MTVALGPSYDPHRILLAAHLCGVSLQPPCLSPRKDRSWPAFLHFPHRAALRV